MYLRHKLNTGKIGLYLTPRLNTILFSAKTGLYLTCQLNTTLFFGPYLTCRLNTKRFQYRSSQGEFPEWNSPKWESSPFDLSQHELRYWFR